MMIFWFPLVFILALWFMAVTVAVVVLWNRKGPVRQEEIDRLRKRIDDLENASRPAKPETPALQPRSEPAPAGEAAPPPEVPPKTPVAPPPRATLPPPPPPAQPRPELEALIGGNWLLKIGILAIVLGALYFLKYAFDNQWIGNTGRVLIGVFAGIGLLYGSEVFRKKDYTLYGQALAAGGISILYLSIYAAFNFYSLIAQVPALLFMALVTAVSSLLSARYRSKPLAVMSLPGGVFTPYWL